MCSALNMDRKSKLNAFVESIVDKQTKNKRSDKLIDCETVPLLGGSDAVVNIEEFQSAHRGFVSRHRNKFVAMLALVLLVYLVTATFCGWNVDSCHSPK